MRYYFQLLLVCLLMIAPKTNFAGNPNLVTAHYKVNGVCEKCQKRIEDATYLPGIKYASWNADTHDLLVRYDSTKTSPEVFLKSIADAGYDNEKYTAPNKAYGLLPECCHYRTKHKMKQ